ncbi:MAG: M23 family metallopeptidase [Candidatus Rokubacteria bacterium]|nr:M23 family metallopeptidase [Candidatus Rokubacteria bacterium]
MSRPRRFNLLVVYGDGTRVLRLNIPRWLVGVTAAALLLGLLSVGAVWGDYLFLKRQWGQIATLQRLVMEQHAQIDGSRQRVAEAQGEIDTWRDLHARIWQPLGPEARGSRERSGVGGGTGAGEAPGPVTLARELDRLVVSLGEEGQKLRALNRLMERAGPILGSLPSRWPVRGAVNSEFGRRLSPWTGAPELHGGIDISAESGTPVKAPAPGIVTLASSTPDFGLTVAIDHGHEIKTVFGHLQKILVANGQRVDRGQQIALSGNTGKSTGPHLHYEILVKGQPVNPRGYLWD